MIRPRMPADLPQLIEALHEVHLQDAYPSAWPEQPEDFLNPADTLAGWVAEVDGRLVGQVLLRHVTPPPSWLVEAGLTDPDFLVVSRLFIASSRRGQGLAEALFQAVWGEAEKRGGHPVLDVHHKNHAAIRLYERLGWQRVASVKANWTDPDGSIPTVHVYLPPQR